MTLAENKNGNNINLVKDMPKHPPSRKKFNVMVVQEDK